MIMMGFVYDNITMLELDVGELAASLKMQEIFGNLFFNSPCTNPCLLIEVEFIFSGTFNF